MIPITTKITLEQRDYLDKKIKEGEFASYGHAFRALLAFHKKAKRELARLRTENYKLKAKIEQLEEIINSLKK